MNALSSASNSRNTQELEKTRWLYVTRKDHIDLISRDLHEVLKNNLWIKWIRSIKFFNNYLVTWLTDEEFKKSKNTIFAEAPVNDIYEWIGFSSYTKWKQAITIESNPWQYDNRVDAIKQNLILQTWTTILSRFYNLEFLT